MSKQLKNLFISSISTPNLVDQKQDGCRNLCIANLKGVHEVATFGLTEIFTSSYDNLIKLKAPFLGLIDHMSLSLPPCRRAGNGVEASESSLRQDFLTYLLSLTRGSEDEHGDSLPKLEMTSLRHVAYILDAFVYYLRSKIKAEIKVPKERTMRVANIFTGEPDLRR